LYCRSDDIQDNSILRRGIPVAHSIYGVGSTINVTNYLILKALKSMQRLNHPDAITVCTEQLIEMCFGKGLEICWRDNYTCPSLEEYKQMAKKSKDKTEPCVGLSGTVSFHILLPDIQFIHFNAVMFTAVVVVLLRNKKGLSDQTLFITVNQVKRCNM
jgi:hypothetical protein